MKKRHHTEVEGISIKLIDKIIEEDHEAILGMTMEETIIKNKVIEIEVKVETITKILIEKVVRMTICEVEILVETGVE